MEILSIIIFFPECKNPYLFLYKFLKFFKHNDILLYGILMKLSVFSYLRLIILLIFTCFIFNEGSSEDNSLNAKS